MGFLPTAQLPRGSDLGTDARSMKRSRTLQLARARALAKSGDALRIRQRAGLSIRDLAGELDVWPSTVNRWERGERVPRGEAALRWVALLLMLADHYPPPSKADDE
jgi:DNA-binding transcriptional regulator YiaG